MKTRRRAHPVSPSAASTPRTPALMGKRSPTGTRMGVKGSDPNLYSHNGDLIDTKAIQAEVVRRTQENIAAKAVASTTSAESIGQAVATADARPLHEVLKDFKTDYGKMPWFRGASTTSGDRLLLMVDGNYKGETPESYRGRQITLVMVDKARAKR